MSLAPPDLPSPAPTPDGHPPPLPMTPAAGPVDPSDAAQSRLRAEIETQLLRLSQDLYEMEVCAGEVGKDMEGAVPQYLEKINAGFASLSALAGRMTESVPKQVVESIDAYRNPHVYTKSTLTRAAGENQYALGRMLGLEVGQATQGKHNRLEAQAADQPASASAAPEQDIKPVLPAEVPTAAPHDAPAPDGPESSRPGHQTLLESTSSTDPAPQANGLTS
ncbi:hypothetical protein JCM24511_04076 [Saitozyma sp. JCM 24511]|nr:hypothetical protein JCM24511_04076 [Saitozyma sp. JCM 24511]